MEALRRALIGKHNTTKHLLCISTFGMGGIAVPQIKIPYVILIAPHISVAIPCNPL